MIDEWRCHFCEMEVGAFELGDGRLIGYACVATALREAETLPPEIDLQQRWGHLHLGDLQ